MDVGGFDGGRGRLAVVQELVDEVVGVGDLMADDPGKFSEEVPCPLVHCKLNY